MDNGNASSDFFSPSNRPEVLELFDYKDDLMLKEDLDEILTRFNVVLSIVNSDNYIDVDAFEDYCKTTQIKLKQVVPWMDISSTG